MAIDVALEVLTDDDFLITVDRKSTSEGSYVNGLFVAGSESSTPIKVSMQPATADDYQNMEEGERVSGLQVMFGLDELKGSRDNTEFDVIEGYLGADWKVVTSESWIHHGYYRTVITRLPKPVEPVDP